MIKDIKKGTIGTMGTGGFGLTHARGRATHDAIDKEWGLDEDSDLWLVPDEETLAEGSDPHAPLPSIPQEQIEWPWPLCEIVGRGASPAQRDVLTLGALTVLGSTLGRKVRTLYNGKYYSPTMNFFAVAPPASGKGALAMLRHLAQPFHDELLAEWEREMEVYRQKKLRFDNMGKARADLPQEELPVVPVRKFFIISGNNSGTGMQTNIINSDGRGLIFEVEADTLSTSLNADYGHFDDALRKFFDHDPISYFRRTENEHREVSSTYVSVLLSGTPGQVTHLIPNAENGLLSRFMFYYMPPVSEWVSQFGEHEDLTHWYEQLARQWKECVDRLRDVSYLTFELEDYQKEFFDGVMRSLFGRSQDAIGEEAKSIVIRLAHHLLRIMSVVAFLRATETNAFRPDPTVPADNVQDGIVPRLVFGIGQEDFLSCLTLSNVLFRHAMHILSLLPAVAIANRGSADKEALFSSMNETFTRQEFLDKAGEMNIKENTALQWLKRSMKRGQLLKVERATYQFTRAHV